MPPRQPHRSPSLRKRAPAPQRVTRIAAALLAAGLSAPLSGFAQLSGDAAQPIPLDRDWGFSLAPQIVERTVPEGTTPGSFSLGDNASADGSQTTLTGHAELRRYGSIIRADKLHYDADTDTADAYGNVRINDHGNLFVGPRAQMQLEARVGYMLTPTYHLNATGGSGKAERMDMIDDERTSFTHATYTACDCVKPSWYIKASRFDVDQGENVGYAHNGAVFFQGVPIFYSPWLTFPLSNERKSGLLPPTFSMNSSSGFDTTIPYYFNIAPNRDLTLRPRIMQQRGAFLGADFRYLGTTYRGTLTGEDMPWDAKAKLSNRYAIYWQHNQDLGNGFGAYVNYNKVSDKTYTSDLANNENIVYNGAQLLFQQEAGFTFNKGPWSVLTRVQRWQTLQSDIVPPYSREPEINVNYAKYDVGGFDYGATANFTRFQSSNVTMPEGNRALLDPYVSYPIVRPGWFFIPKAQYHLASYDLTRIPSTINSIEPSTVARNTSVAIPTLSVDTGMQYERHISLFGTDYIQTLEPRLYYTYTPYRDQSQIPVFDTAPSDFGLAEIFTSNTFVGEDRIADGSRLTAALSTRFINAGSGDERARFLVAQQYYFREQQTTMPNEAVSNAARSDLILGASFKLSNTFATQNAIQYNTGSSTVDRLNTGFAWSPEDRKVVNLAYRYTRANPTNLASTYLTTGIKQVVASAQWPITRNVYAVGRINYAFDSHRLVDGLIGMQYDAPCWVLGVAFQQYASGINSSGQPASGKRVLVQLTLKGLANVDNGLVTAFRNSVPGYVPPPPPAAPLSRFSDYD